MIKITDLTPDQNNANRGTQRGLKALDTSLRQYGAGRSILLDRDNRIIAGNKTVERAADIGLEEVQIIDSDGTKIIAVRRTDLDLEDDGGKARALATYDNRAGQLDLEWDVDALSLVDADVLSELWTDKELAEIGFNVDEPVGEDPGAQIDKAEELREKWGVESGQLWRLGEHRLICGDCTDKQVVERVMGGEKAELVVSDPPYNVAYSSRGSNKDSWGEIENDDMSEEEFYGWLLLVGAAFDYAMASGAPIYLCHGDTDRKAVPFIDLFGDMKWKRSATIIWAKQAASMGWQDYRSQHECLSYGWKEGDKHYFTADRSQTTVWEISRDAQASYQHPTQKPVELFEKAISNSSEAGDVVADFFLGSGTTLIACERLGRKCRAVEISPAYVSVALQRFYDMTGVMPVLVDL